MTTQAPYMHGTSQRTMPHPLMGWFVQPRSTRGETFALAPRIEVTGLAATSTLLLRVPAQLSGKLQDEMIVVSPGQAVAAGRTVRFSIATRKRADGEEDQRVEQSLVMVEDGADRVERTLVTVQGRFDDTLENRLDDALRQAFGQAAQALGGPGSRGRAAGARRAGAAALAVLLVAAGFALLGGPDTPTSMSADAGQPEPAPLSADLSVFGLETER